MYDKPFKTYDEQIEFLKDKYKLIITDDIFAKEALETFTYYDLINGYKEIFMHPTEEYFIPDKTIESLMAFRILDCEFQNLLFEISFHIENRFKSIVAYHVSNQIGVDAKDYLDINNMQQPPKAQNQKILKKNLEKLIQVYKPSNPKKKPDMPTAHYVEKHNHVPAWILFRNATFSQVTTYYRFLLPDIKDAIAQDLLRDVPLRDSSKKIAVLPMLNFVRRYRNVIAHNLKFVTTRFYFIQDLKKNESVDFMRSLFPRSLYSKSELINNDLDDIYTLICVMLLLLGKSNFTIILIQKLNSFFHVWNSEQAETLGVNFSDYAATIGLPANTEDRLNAFKDEILETQRQKRS